MNRLFSDLNPLSIRGGFVFGAALGVAHIVNGFINNLMNLDATANDLLNKVFFTTLLLIFSLAGLWVSRITGRVGAGTQASVFAAIVGSMIGAISLLIITFTFMDTIRQNTFVIQDFMRSGAKNMDTFIVEDAFGAIFFGSLFSVVLAIVLGTVGGYFGKLYGKPAQL